MSSSVHFPLAFAGSAWRLGRDRRDTQAARNRRSIIHRTPEKNRAGTSPAEVDPGCPVVPGFIVLFILRRRERGCPSGFWRAGGVNPPVVCPTSVVDRGALAARQQREGHPKRTRDVGKPRWDGGRPGEGFLEVFLFRPRPGRLPGRPSPAAAGPVSVA